MRQAMRDCLRLTEELSELTGGKILVEEEYERITLLLEERAAALEGIFPPFTDEEMEVGNRIAAFNRAIDASFPSLKRGIGLKLKELKKADHSVKKYQVYNAAGADGYFYDKRK